MTIVVLGDFARLFLSLNIELRRMNWSIEVGRWKVEGGGRSEKGGGRVC